MQKQLFQQYEQLQKAFNELPSKEKQQRNNTMKGSAILECLLKKNGINYEEDAFRSLKSEERSNNYDNILKLLFKKIEW